VKTPPNGADWIHEIKHGGYRTISVTNAAIGSGLRLLECQVEAEYRKAVVRKIQEAIARGAWLSRQGDRAPSRSTDLSQAIASKR